MIAYRIKNLDGESPEAASLWSYGCLGMVEEHGSVVAFFKERTELPLKGEWEEVEERDYVAEYQATLDPVRLPGIVVAPTHRRVELAAGERALWLDPGMAFGTGHHETTRLALTSLSSRDLVGKSVLDVGAGTGILAIAADLLGARSAYGVDVDAATVPVARENATLNRSRARFAHGTLEHAALPGRFDIIVANLYAELHAELLPAFARRLTKNGSLLITGILRSLRSVVLAAVPVTLEVVGESEEGEWSLIELTPRQGAARE